MKSIFAGEGRLTDDATTACKVNYVDPQELVPRSLESFKRPGLSVDGAQRLYNASKKKRQGLLHLVQRHM